MYLAQSTNWGYFPDRIGIQKCWFLRRGENRSTRRKTSRSKDENQQTQPTYDAESGNRTRVTLVTGKCSHHCTVPAPQKLALRFHNQSHSQEMLYIVPTYKMLK